MAHATLSRNAVLVGLCALIPLPWVDDYVARRLCRRSWGAMAADLGLFWWPIRKMFRTFFYFLTVKDAVDWGIETALRGEMVRRALAAGALPARASMVRLAMDAAFVDHRHSPLTRWALRQLNPPLAWPAGSDPLTGAVGWLAQAGGGALVLARFEAAVAAPEALLAAPGVPAAPTPEVV